MKKTYHCNVAELGENSSQGLNFRRITPKSRVLDVGCAVGDMGIALTQVKQCSVWGIEYDAERAQAARETNAYEQVWQIDLDTLTDAGLPGLPDDFDFIVLGDVLEHLKDPLSTLIRLKRFLKRGGLLLLSLPNIAHCSIKCGLLLDEFKYTPEGLLDESHLRFFTWHSIAQFCASAGVKVLESHYTFLGIEGFGSPTDYRRLPGPILQYVFGDPHSFVCQYVLTLQPSELPETDLAADNRAAIQLEFGKLPTSIQQYIAAVQKQVASASVPQRPEPSRNFCISVKNDSYAADVKKNTPSLVAHISFFYVPERIVYLNQEVEGLLTIPDIDIFIHTNQAFEHPMLHGNVHLVVHDLGETHPFYLTWKSRPFFRDQLGKYDYFLYLEDDILFTQESFSYYRKYHPICKRNGVHLGFLRVEQSKRNHQWYLLDVTRPLQNRLKMDSLEFVVNDVNPYYAMWILDAEEMKRFITEFPQEYDLTRPFWGNNFNMVREDAAISPGCTLYSKTVIFDEKGANLWHLTNNYVDHDSIYATLSRDRLQQS